MAEIKHVRAMLVEDNAEFARLVTLYLQRFEEAQFEVLWKANGQEGIDHALQDPGIDVILMDYFLPGLNGLEVTKKLKEKKVRAPVVFLTVNKDVNLAVEVMKVGVEDYLVKEEITTSVFPKTLLAVVEKRRLAEEVAELEIRKKRLEAMQELVVGITAQVDEPLLAMRRIVEDLLAREREEKAVKYLEIMRENLDRLSVRLEKLRNLQEDKTVKYIKDIKMIDLS